MLGNVLVVIPARGGSKGIPRKNLRPLAGKPLLYYSIKASMDSKYISRVVVTTDDDEIALFAERFGAAVIKRPKYLAGDDVTIDPVVLHAVQEAEKNEGMQFGLILTVQPTSPLITSADIDQVVRLFELHDVDTVISAVEDKHLRWRECKGLFVPEYEKRVNRQQLPQTYRETGAIIACQKRVLDSGSRVGQSIMLYVVDEDKSIDIDSYIDFMRCENMLRRKRVLINVIGSKCTGLGHAFRSVLIALELVNYQIIFMCTEDDDLAYKYITGYNYAVQITQKNKTLETILSIKPDMVINDVLDTSADYIIALKKAGIKSVNFEDMGFGAEVADLVINALYPHQIPSEHILVGPKYFCLRDEFLHLPTKAFNEAVKRVIISFGGVDEGNLTGRILKLIGKELADNDIEMDVILGPGYDHQQELYRIVKDLGCSSINIVKDTPRISEFMTNADLAITSAGRTVLELAAVGVPMIVICQNNREVSHKFASSENGIINLGLRNDLKDVEILNAIRRLITDADLRKLIVSKLKKINMKSGKKRVIEKITSLLN